MKEGYECASCHQYGNLKCKACHLVVYCGRRCQTAHWKEHKKYCKSPFMKIDWQPEWTKGHFLLGAAEHDEKQHFYGNMPAFDIVQLASNEGEDYQGDLRLLFAASGDLRNVVKTVASLPEHYNGSISVAINDRDFAIVARNIIICLIALTVPEDNAVDCMMHLWFSTLITQEHAKILRELQLLVKRGMSKMNATVIGNGCGTFNMDLMDEDWDLLLDYFQPPNGLSAAQATQRRKDATSGPSCRPRQEREMCWQLPAHRIANARYYDDGVFLPFGSDRKAFDVPNPTFFQFAIWPVNAHADITAGWSLQEIMAQNSCPATNDLHGKLFFLIRDLLIKFHRRVNSPTQATNFHFLHMDAMALDDHLTNVYFDRIEVSNTSDSAYIGVPRMIEHLAPLLQPRSVNPHATLIMLFMKAIFEAPSLLARGDHYEAEHELLKKYKPGLSQYTAWFDVNLMMNFLASFMFLDMDKFFDEYMVVHDFEGIAQRSYLSVPPHGVSIKKENTIIEKWPLRLKLQPGEPGAQEEFEILQSQVGFNSERYVDCDFIDSFISVNHHPSHQTPISHTRPRYHLMMESPGKQCASCHQYGALKAHWKEHKQHCKSPLMEESWQPIWVIQQQVPDMGDGEKPAQLFGGMSLFGDFPALDILQLAANEGNAYDRDLSLLFAASGDMRNMLMSITSLPNDYTRTTNVVMNDSTKTNHVVVRNIIITLIALVAPDDDRAVDCMLHVWYSAFITAQDRELLEEKVRPLVWNVVKPASDSNMSLTTKLAYTWHFGSSSCKVEMQKGVWDWLVSSLCRSPGLSAAQAQRARASITHVEARQNFVDRHYVALKPTARVCAQRFRDDGLLLPFGSDRREFNVPNPTLFQYVAGVQWPVKDDADPLYAWDLQEVTDIDLGLATNDLYGKLHHHVKNKLTQFRHRLATQKFAFHFTNVSPEQLPTVLKSQHFDRIETSDTADAYRLGIAPVILRLGPLLKTRKENPHATLITFFTNAVQRISNEAVDMEPRVREGAQAFKYLPTPTIMFDAATVNALQSSSLFRDSEEYFSRYMVKASFAKLEEVSGDFVEGGLSMKKEHTIIEKFPYGLKIPFGQPGYQAEFDARIAARLSGGERYVEWKRNA
ncbi:unnamed protein product [Zymoseptoria tritici ST99CH_3D1]|nr:unnamed protein product [Zymoseptoria tritici ST99CH_3D1]